jgi:hypothetical protein
VAPDPADVSRAVVVWTGYGVTAWPQRDETRLVARFGVDAALVLAPAVRRLEDAFYLSEARQLEPDLKRMGDMAAADFRRLHPEVSDEAVEALAWCYTYDFK